MGAYHSTHFHGQMVQSFSSVEDDSCSLGIFQWLLGLNHKYRSKQNTDKSTSWVLIDHNSRDLSQTATAAKTSQNKGLEYGAPSGPKFNFWILLVLLAFDIVVLQFVLTSAIQHSSFQFLYSNWRFDIVCFTIQHPSLRNSTSKFTQFNIQLWKMHVFDIQPQSSQWQSVWAQKTIKILPVYGLAKAGHATLDSSFYHVKMAPWSFFLYPTRDRT